MAAHVDEVERKVTQHEEDIREIYLLVENTRQENPAAVELERAGGLR